MWNNNCILFVIIINISPFISASCSSNYEVETETVNYWQGKIQIQVPEDVSDWTVEVLFDNDVTNIDCALADVSGLNLFFSDIFHNKKSNLYAHRQ